MDDTGVRLPPVEAVDALPPEALPGFVAQLAALSLRAAARLSAPAASTKERKGDRMLDIQEASAGTGMSRSWLYRQRGSLPFAKKIGRKVLFSEAGMVRWLATRGR